MASSTGSALVPAADVATTRPRRPAGLDRVRRHRLLIGAALLVMLLLAMLASLMIGANALTPADVWSALDRPTGSEADIIVRTLRLPRTLLALLAGLALGVAGALMQGHTRNPLADPGLLGVTQGAAFAMVVGIVGFGFTSLVGFIWFGFLGAVIAATAVFLIGAKAGGISPVTLALAGTAVSTFLYALTSAVVLLDKQALDVFRFWQAGAVAGRGFGVLWQVLPFVLLGLVLALAGAPGLNAIALGDDVARSLGQRIGLVRGLGIVAVTLLTGATVAACGALGFVGLIVPHIARALSGPDYRWLLPYAGLLGAVLVIGADTVGRVVAGSEELEVGIVMAILGGPVFVALVRRRRPVRL